MDPDELAVYAVVNRGRNTSIQRPIRFTLQLTELSGMFHPGTVQLRPLFFGDSDTDVYDALLNQTDTDDIPATGDIAEIETILRNPERNCVFYYSSTEVDDISEVVAAVRTERPDIPVFVFVSTPETAETMLEAGATDYIWTDGATHDGAFPLSRVQRAVSASNDMPASPDAGDDPTTNTTTATHGRLTVDTDDHGSGTTDSRLAWYGTVLRAIPDEIYTMDAEGRHLSVIPPAGSDRTVAGYDPAEMIGEHASLVMDEADIDRARAAIKELLRDDECKRTSFEMDLVTRDGNRVPYENHIALLPADDGEFAGTVGVLRDISDRTEKERKLTQIRQHITDVVWMTSPEKDSMDFVSEAYEDVWGRSTESLLQNPESFVDAIHPEDRERVQGALARQQAAPESYDETYRVVRPDGDIRWVRDRSAGVYRDGELQRIVGVATDITERKEREAELRLKDRVLAAAPIGVTIMETTRPGTPIIYANDEFADLTGYDETDVQGRSWSTLAGPETDQATLDRLQAAVTREETLSTVMLAYRQDGTPFWDRITVAPVRDDDSVVTHYVIFHQDVTEEKEYEHRLERQFDEFSDVLREDLRRPVELAQTQLDDLATDTDADLSSVREHLQHLDRLISDISTVHSFNAVPRELSEATLKSLDSTDKK